MGKRGSDGALVKRPASNVSSIQGALLSDVVVAELEATRNVNDFRKRARALGVSTQYKNSDGQWRDRARADILDECRRRLEESRAPAHAAASVSAVPLSLLIRLQLMIRVLPILMSLGCCLLRQAVPWLVASMLSEKPRFL